ncbi:MAG: histidine kinase, partial [Chloroflexota bacterium]|nr:histidine kinase [Chloroflexota bacterium]
QQDARTRPIPVIFITALVSAEDKVKAFESGGVDYVTKPLQQAEVLARIQTHLRQRNLTRDLQVQNQQLTQSHGVERTRLFEAVNQQRTQLRALTQQLTQVQENERRQLARELHDEVGQALTAIRINLAAIQKELPAATRVKVQERMDETTLLTDQIVEQIRELSLDLRPPMLDDLGLTPTLRWYLRRYSTRTAIATELMLTGLESRLAPALETALYRVTQEALTNIAKHAAATQVKVRLLRDGASVVLRIEDDGKGFDVAATVNAEGQAPGMGLLGMRERMTLLHGSFDITSGSNRGTCLHFSVPWEPFA